MAKVKSLKKFYCTWTCSQVIFKVSSKFFFTSLQKPVCITFGRHILYLYYIYKRYFFPSSLSPTYKARKKISLSFWIRFTCRFVWSIYLVLHYYLVNIFNYSLLYFLEYLKNTFATSYRYALGAGKVKPFFCLHDLYSREQNHIPFEVKVSFM